ncbi:MAG: glycosyltransferase [Candidatus Marithrix sp.]
MYLLKKLKNIFDSKKQLLFYRDFQSFTGGHLKVWDYFNHTLQSKQYYPQIHFSPTTIWENNPWLNHAQINKTWQLEQANCLFLAGLDWNVLTQIPDIPIINFIQHIRHSVPTDPRYIFLRNKAIRICVSEEVTEALRTSQQINGPIFTNPNGINIQALSIVKHRYNLLIAGLKQPTLAINLQKHLNIENVKVLISPLARKDFLNIINQAKITVFLPSSYDEGFFLPALEGMVLNTMVICPDCVGNRSFCKHYVNCLMPEYNITGILAMIDVALSMSESKRKIMLNNAKQTTQQYTLIQEQQNFLDILDNVTNIW